LSFDIQFSSRMKRRSAAHEQSHFGYAIGDPLSASTAVGAMRFFRSTKRAPQGAACRVCGSRVEYALCAFLELFHSGERPNSAAIDITATISSASSCLPAELAISSRNRAET
jgi:hypothetical protein